MDRIPFGRYKGWRVRDLPDDYLVWLAGNGTPPLSTLAVSEMAVRRIAGPRGRGGGRPEKRDRVPKSRLPPELRPWALEIVTRGYQALAAERHPDVGGNADDMRKINAAVTELRALLGSDRR